MGSVNQSQTESFEYTVLVCLPFAGGSAVVYAGWRRLLPELDVHPVELPGRGSRANEPPPATAEGLLDDVVGRIAAIVDAQPAARLVLYGHSFGARLAHAAVAPLAAVAPVSLLAVGAAPPPDGRPLTGYDDSWSDERVLAEFRGAPGAALLDEPDWRQMLLPALRADLACGEALARRTPHSVACPILALAGADDRYCNLARMRDWAALSELGAAVCQVPGGHFFVQENEALPAVFEALRAHAAAAKGAG